MLKVLIFPSYGNNKTSIELEDLMNKYPFPENRYNSEIIDFIEKTYPSIEYYPSLYTTNYQIDNKLISITEVDDNRPWKIEDYDGSEYIQYLDYNIIDKKSNYCDYISKSIY